MKRQILARVLRVSLVSVILLAVVWVAARALLNSNRSQVAGDATIMLHEVERSTFEAFVTEPGDLASSSNKEVRCQVESRGTPGTAILWICEEGQDVVIGDPLVEFDDSLLQTEYTTQEIQVANDEALWIQAKSEQDKAERSLTEFTKGLFQQEKNIIEGEIFVAEEELKRSQASLVHGLKLAAQGFITDLQLQGETFAVEKGKRDVQAAKLKLSVYERFTYEKTVGEYEADIKKHVARVTAALKTFELSKSRLEDIDQQRKSCKVTAPSQGQVVYANDERKGVVIEEGSLIRDNQVVIRLPDTSQMEVHVRVNESHVNRVRENQEATIELDADRDCILTGKVKDVAPYPYPLRWHGAPLEYGTVITIRDPPVSLRPGLRAKVKIYFEKKADVLQVPLAAVIEYREQYFCLVREKDSWRTQPVTVGSNNNKDVIVKSGLNVGDQVALTPFRYIKRSDLAGNVPAVVAGKRPRSRVQEKTVRPKVSADAPGNGSPAS